MRKLLFLSLLAAGCSNYDPDLGPTPFLCGDDEPRCPEGYSCEISGTQEICVEGDGGNQLNVDGNTQTDGANNGECADDGNLEPNDTYQTAFSSPNAFSTPITYGPLSICPATDKDHFKVPFPAGVMKAFTVTVTWDSGPALTGAILGDGGQTLTALTPAGNRAIRACAAMLPGNNDYYAQISGTAENNYRVALAVTDNCAAP